MDISLQEKLFKKIAKEKHHQEKLEQAQHQYNEIVNQPNGPYTFNSDSIIEKFTTADNRNFYFFYGCLQPTPNEKSSELAKAFLKNFQIDQKQRYTFVYFNNQTQNSNYYFEFRRIFSILPNKIIKYMDEFVLIKPYFYIKAFGFMGLGSINNYFTKKYSMVESCIQFIQEYNIPAVDFVSFVPQIISEEFEKGLKRKTSLVNYRINLEGQNLSQEKLREKTQFELTVKALISKEVYNIQDYELGELGIPIIIQLLIFYFKTKPEGLSIEGIFRKSVSIDQQSQTLTQLCRRNYQYLQKITNPHLIASLIKKFFNNLKMPIIPFNLFQQLMHDQKVADKKKYIKQIISKLPKLNFLTLIFLIDFIKKDVISRASQSKMTAHNLAICFSPSLMRSQKPSNADLIYAGKSVMVTDMLITQFDYIFGNQQQRNKLFTKNINDSIRSFKKGIRNQLHIVHEPLSEIGQESSTISKNKSSQKDEIKETAADIEIPKNVVKSCIKTANNNLIQQKNVKSVILTNDLNDDDFNFKDNQPSKLQCKFQKQQMQKYRVSIAQKHQKSQAHHNQSQQSQQPIKQQQNPNKPNPSLNYNNYNPCRSSISFSYNSNPPPPGST